MLTLTRKVGESIRIGDNIEIVVKEIRKNQVRIGIVAPREVKIFREEVYQNIVQENRASAQTDLGAVEDLVIDLDVTDDPASDASQESDDGSTGTPPVEPDGNGRRKA